MSKYLDDDERAIRVRQLVDEWKRSGLVDAAQHERIAADLHVALRRTNRFLRVTLFGFTLLIIAAACGLVAVTFDVNDPTSAGILCVAAAAICAGLAEFAIGRFRLYRFGIEEACAVAAMFLFAFGALLLAGSSVSGLTGDRPVFVALIIATVTAAAVYHRYGYVYAAVAAMLCAAAAPLSLALSLTAQRLLAAAVLGGWFLTGRTKHRILGDEYPGDAYGAIEAAAWLGIYAVLNLQLTPEFDTSSRGSTFYWFTFAMTWLLPAAGLWMSIANKDRQLLDVSLLMALATLFTNKPYLGAARTPWDPILLGALLIGVAVVLRRWLSSGDGETRRGYTATRLLRSDKDELAVAAIISTAFPGTPVRRHAGSEAPDSFNGGRSGGAGGGAAF